MSKKFLNSVIPFTAELKKLFGVEKVEDIREELKNNTRVEGGDLIPGAVEIPYEKMIEAGFEIKFFLKDATEAAVDTFDSGIIIASIQHKNPRDCYLKDGLSYQFDPKSEVEISTLSSAIVKHMVPEAFGADYDISKLFESSSDRIREINEEMANNKKIRDEKIKKYEANPELARKHTKKALENLRHKHQEVLASGTKSHKDIEEFQSNALRLIGEIFGINGISKFEDLKEIPEIKDELEKSGSLKDVIEKLSGLVSAKVEAEDKAKNLVEEKEEN